jgi:glycosyltransferase involved in cell wall biosynthesis
VVGNSGGMTSKAPAVSIVIPTFNRANALRDALQGLLLSDERDFEVLIMDQSDEGSTREVVEAFGDPRFCYHRMSRKGACPARNMGAALARADIVAFTDDDCVPAPNWTARIKQAFAEDAELAFVVGKLTAPPLNGRAGDFPTFEPGVLASRGKTGWRIVMLSAGANMSCRKSFLRALGGFDELLGPSVPSVKGNDSSMCYKIWSGGMKWAARDDIDVLHLNGFREEAKLQDLYIGYGYGIGINYARFVRRGDLRALRLFLLEQLDLIRPPLKRLLRLERPTGAKMVVAHAAGFIRGLLVPPKLGYVGGEEFRRLELESQMGCDGE